MKITILNGNPTPSPFDEYLGQLSAMLTSSGNTITHIRLRDLKIRYCIGCFGCWVKTPGVCSSNDESCQMRRAVIHSDFTLWAAPLRMGFPSTTLKMAVDKSIPLLHPYFEVHLGEAHHRKRYKRYPRLGLLVEPEADTDERDLQIVGQVFSRAAVNMKSRLEFAMTTEAEVEAVARRVLGKPVYDYPPKVRLEPLPGEAISPPQRLTLFNGSPRGRKGNTPILLEQFGAGFASQPGHSYEVFDLNRLKSIDTHLQAFASAECVWLGFPLYVDSMPGMVKNFIEALEPFKGRKGNPPLGFLVQNGFPEAHHCRYVERYLQKMAARLGSPYLGTIVKGGGEGVRLMPDEQNASLFTALQGLGKNLAQNGRLDPDLLAAVVGVERYPAYMAPVFMVFTRLPIASMYWDTQLKENGAYEQRYAQPYLEES